MNFKEIFFLNSIKNDFLSSVVVFLVALPLCLGIALASGAPLFSGLIAGVVGGIVIGSLSKSHLSTSTCGNHSGVSRLCKGRYYRSLFPVIRHQRYVSSHRANFNP